MMPIILRGHHVVVTSIALQDTMTIRDTALGVAEVRDPLVGVIVLQVLVVEVPIQEEVVMETTAAGVATTVIRPADLLQATIATLRVVIVTAIVAAVVVGDTALDPLRRCLALIPPPRGQVGILLVPLRGVRTAVPQGSTQTPLLEVVTAHLIITAVVLVLAPPLLDKDLLLMTDMDHRLVVVVVQVVVVVRTAADRPIVEVIQGLMVLRLVPAEVEAAMISHRAMAEEVLRMGVLKLLQVGLDRHHLPVPPLGGIRLGVHLPHLAVFQPPLEPATVLELEGIVGLAQLVDPVGVPLLVTDLIELLNLLFIA